MHNNEIEACAFVFCIAAPDASEAESSPFLFRFFLLRREGLRVLFCTRPHSDDRARSSLFTRSSSASDGLSAVGCTTSYTRCSLVGSCCLCFGYGLVSMMCSESLQNNTDGRIELFLFVLTTSIWCHYCIPLVVISLPCCRIILSCSCWQCWIETDMIRSVESFLFVLADSAKLSQILLDRHYSPDIIHQIGIIQQILFIGSSYSWFH